MSVDRAYRCNLCRTGEAPIGKADLFGIYWKQGATRETIEIRGVREVEHHLCRDCIESISSFNIPKRNDSC